MLEELAMVGHYSMRRAAQKLNVSTTFLYRLEFNDKLHPVRVDGRIWYPKEELDELLKTFVRPDSKYKPKHAKKVPKTSAIGWSMREEKRVAAKVFNLIRLGKTRREVIAAAKTTPAIVQKLWEEYHYGSFEEAHQARLRAEEESADLKLAESLEAERKKAQWWRRKERLIRARTTALGGRWPEEGEPCSSMRISVSETASCTAGKPPS